MTARPFAAALCLAVASGAGGCFHPRYPEGLACSETGSCPPGQHCFGGFCYSAAPPPPADLAAIGDAAGGDAAPPPPPTDMSVVIPSSPDLAVPVPPDLAVPGPPAPVCSAFGYFCGSDQVQNGVPDTLYNCPGPGAPTSSQACALGCLTRPNMRNDFCRTANGCPNSPPGYWCGNDQLGGDPNWLYYCLTVGAQPESAHPCAHGCTSIVNQNDQCVP
jgi:hypothetical protein